MPSFLFSLKSARCLFPPQRHRVSATPALCLLRHLKLGFSTRVFPGRRLDSPYCLQELGDLFFLSSFSLHFRFGLTPLPMHTHPFSSGAMGIPCHAPGVTFCQLFTFRHFDGEIRVVAISLLAPPAACPFPDQVFGAERVSPQFPEEMGSRRGKESRF